MMETRFNGGCHCGNLTVQFESPFRPSELPLRADSCSFCRKHGARTAADPRGRARLTIHDPNELIRYRFGLRTAEFLVCRRCGVYVGAVVSAAGKWYVTLNVNAFDCAPELTQPARPVSYDGETESERIGRRIANWSPLVEIREGTV
jgi:hypothetical protein